MIIIMNLKRIDLLCIAVTLWIRISEVSCEELYVGCYSNFTGFSIEKNPIQSISQCLNECRSHISSFAAIKDGSSCYCGNITNTRVSSSNCNLTCVVDSGTCGGNNLFAVYTDIPTYQGCFMDDINNRDMNLTIKDDWFMTIDKCYERCSSSNYSFIGVQNGGTCFCGQQYGKHGRAPETECNMTCTGNGNQTCGGLARNSIFSVGRFPGLNKNYSEVFHCLNGATIRNGTCNSKTCRPGWKGTKCNQRDCIINNGNCGQQKCAEVKIGNQVISECVCKEGFQSISIYDECTDIDECSLNMCNITTSTCNNNIGSFDCICKEGFVKIPLDQVDYKGECDNKLYELTCVRKEFDQQHSLEGNITPDKKGIIILATFLSLSLITQMFLIGGVLFYRSKNRKLSVMLRDQNTDAMTNSTYRHLDFSSQSLDDHNYSEMAKNNKLKK